MIIRSGVLCSVLVAIINCQNSKEPTNVTVTLRALRPKGFRAYISADADQANFLFFDGKLYDSLEKAINSAPDIGFLWGVATRQADGGWLFEEHNQKLTIGTVINYAVFIPDHLPTGSNSNGRASLTINGDLPDYKLFKVTALEDLLAPGPNCLATATRVRGRRVCSGEVIFEDNFDTFREDLWQIEQYIPSDHPEYPFVSYQKLTSRDPNVFVENGSLHIVPKLQEDILRGKNDSILSGSLDLTDGCTRSKCSKVAFGADILPPIVSGRLTSLPFSFTYGRVYVKAKIPQGDWLYPEILLEPLFKKYVGRKEIYSILKIAVAGGNREINEDTYGNKVLRGRPITDETCVTLYTFFRTIDRGFWGDDFHEYSLLWTPEVIELSVDGNEYLRFHLTDLEMTYRCHKDGSSDLPPRLDDYLHLTLGVAAGGITEFPDDVRTGDGMAKPWRNGDAKATLKFWQKRQSWLPTWTNPGLVVDYVKVVAL